MNRQGRTLNLKNTRFDSPHGMSNPNNYSTAHDMALLSIEAMKNTYIQSVVSEKFYKC